jgi:hypothetical protein
MTISTQTGCSNISEWLEGVAQVFGNDAQGVALVGVGVAQVSLRKLLKSAFLEWTGPPDLQRSPQSTGSALRLPCQVTPDLAMCPATLASRWSRPLNTKVSIGPDWSSAHQTGLACRSASGFICTTGLVWCAMPQENFCRALYICGPTHHQIGLVCQATWTPL